MKFTSVEKALEWYFNKNYKRKPVKLKSLDLIKTRIRFQAGDLESEFDALVKIDSLLSQHIKPRDAVILRNEFVSHGTPQAALAHMFDLSGDRSIRKIRERSVKKLKKVFRISGLLSTLRYEEPVYVHG